MPRTKTILSPKEQIFVTEWLVDKNAKQAAIRAGYSARSAANTGHDMLQIPRIQSAVRKALKDQQTRTLITADQVLKDIHRISKTAEGRGEYMAALKGLELIGKHYKLFTEKHEVTGKDGAPLRPFAEFSTEELREALAKLTGALVV